MPWGRTVEEDRQQFLEEFARAGANRREVCRRFEISPKAGYALWARFQREGEAAVYDRSRRPRTSPGKLDPAVERRIIELRQERRRGARKLRWCLEHEGIRPVPAKSTIEAVLRRNGLISAEMSRRSEPYQRFEYEAPNELWQMDFKGHFALQDGSRCHPLVVVDDHSRYLLALEACANERRTTVQPILTRVFRENGMPKRILADNGAPWGRAGRWSFTLLEVWLMRLDIHAVHGRARHPQTQGKTERLNRTLGEELELDFPGQDGAQAGFTGYRGYYNEERPHEGIGMCLPAERYRPSDRAFPEQLPAVEYDQGQEVRRVQKGGWISYRGQTHRICRAFTGFQVSVRATTTDGVLGVYFCRQLIGRIDLRVESVTHVPGTPLPLCPGHTNSVGEGVHPSWRRIPSH